MKSRYLVVFTLMSVCLFTRCRFRDGAVSAFKGEGGEESYIRQIVKEEVDVSKAEHIDPQSLFLKTGGLARKAWLQKMLLQMPEEVLDHLHKGRVGKVLNKIGNRDREFVDLIASRVRESDLNSFPTLPLEVLPTVQRIAIQKNAQVDAPISGDTETFSSDLKDLSLDVGTCPEEPKVKETLVLRVPDAGDLVERIETMEGTPSHPLHLCYSRNSSQLALLLNRLSVSDSSTIHHYSIAGLPYDIGTSHDLVSALLDAHHGLNVETYVKRVWVDFMGWFWRTQSGELRSIRNPVWFSFLDDKGNRRKLPGEHSEIGLLLYREKESEDRGVKVRERLAQVKFYAGVSSSQHPNQVALWRAKLDKDHPWANPAIEFSERFTSSSGPEKQDDFHLMLEATGGVQRTLQKVHKDFHLPGNGYGVFVCNDSVALTMGLWSTLKADERLERLSHSFPLVRLDEVPIFQKNTPSIEEEVFMGTGIHDEYLRLYPSDATLAMETVADQLKKQRPSLRARNRFQSVLESDRFSSAETLRLFPDISE